MKTLIQSSGSLVYFAPIFPFSEALCVLCGKSFSLRVSQQSCLSGQGQIPFQSTLMAVGVCAHG